MKILACLLSITIGLVATSLSAAATFGPLVSPQALATERDRSNPLILDIRGEAYAKGHIPGSTSAPYGLFRGPKENPGQLLDVATLEERFEALGLDTGRPIVIVPEGKTDTDFGAAARVYWTLKSTGFSDLSILNGGLLAWQAAGLALDTQAFTPQATQLDITFADDWTAGTEQIVAASRGEVDALLLDARPDDFYRGRKSHPAAARPGTIPGAENFAYSGFFEPGSPAMSSIANSTDLRDKLGIDEGRDVVSFCNTGHWAATNWFALSEVAGIENVKLYPGSMVEYSNAGLDMENTPGLFRNFLNKIRGN